MHSSSVLFKKGKDGYAHIRNFLGEDFDHIIQAVAAVQRATDPSYVLYVTGFLDVHPVKKDADGYADKNQNGYHGETKPFTAGL